MSDVRELFDKASTSLGLSESLEEKHKNYIASIPAPTPDDLTKQKARQREAARRYSKAGRAGTVLTGTDDKLG